MNLDWFPLERRAAAGVVIALPMLVVTWAWWNAVPQIGDDDAAFDVVDALFTAVTSKDETRLDRCEEQLHALRDAGRLSARVSKHLDGVIHIARADGWRKAAETLFRFMRAQRRANVF